MGWSKADCQCFPFKGSQDHLLFLSHVHLLQQGKQKYKLDYVDPLMKALPGLQPFPWARSSAGLALPPSPASAPATLNTGEPFPPKGLCSCCSLFLVLFSCHCRVRLNLTRASESNYLFVWLSDYILFSDSS